MQIRPYNMMRIGRIRPSNKQVPRDIPPSIHYGAKIGVPDRKGI